MALDNSTLTPAGKSYASTAHWIHGDPIGKEAPGFSSAIYGSTIPVDLVEGNITEK